MADEWHYAKGEEKHGPVSSGELRRLAREGNLHPTDLVRNDGNADWIPASRIKSLFADAKSPQASPPPLPKASPPAPAEASLETPNTAATGVWTRLRSYCATIWNTTKHFRIFCGSADETVRLCDPETGRQLRCFNERDGPVNAIAFVATQPSVLPATTAPSASGRSRKISTNRNSISQHKEIFMSHRSHKSAATLLAFAFVLPTLLVGCGDRITASNYEKIQNGMTLQEVEGILGKGEEQASSNVDIPGQTIDVPGGGSASVSGISTSMQMMSWQSGTKIITVTFSDGKVIAKANTGL